MTSETVRATSFGAAAGEYDRYRVGVPDEVVDRLLPGGADAVLDLGAGTGAMTRRLVGRAAKVYAVDPDTRMLSVLAEGCPEAETHEGTAERIPLPDDAVDAVVVASAWHWMDPDAALPELARVLRPGGKLVLVWNRRDRTVPWVADLEEARKRITGGDDYVDERIRYFMAEPWLPDAARFGRVETADIRWDAELTKEEIARLMTTYGSFISAPKDRKPEMLRELIDYVHADERVAPAEDREDALVALPMVCHMWRATVTG